MLSEVQVPLQKLPWTSAQLVQCRASPPDRTRVSSSSAIVAAADGGTAAAAADAGAAAAAAAEMRRKIGRRVQSPRNSAEGSANQPMCRPVTVVSLPRLNSCNWSGVDSSVWLLNSYRHFDPVPRMTANRRWELERCERVAHVTLIAAAATRGRSVGIENAYVLLLILDWFYFQSQLHKSVHWIQNCEEIATLKK